MPISDELKNQIAQGILSTPLLVFVEITHASFGTLRFVGNQEDMQAGSPPVTYTGVGLSVHRPDQVPDELPSVQLTISNLTLHISTKFRQVQVQDTDRPTVKAFFALATTPSIIEEGPFDFEVTGSAFGSDTIVLTLSAEDLLTRGFPRKRFLPQNFPLIF